MGVLLSVSYAVFGVSAVLLTASLCVGEGVDPDELEREELDRSLTRGPARPGLTVLSAGAFVLSALAITVLGRLAAEASAA